MTDSDTMSRLPGELPSQGSGVRDSDAKVYGSALPYEQPVSSLSRASDLKEHTPAENMAPRIPGDPMLSTQDEPGPRSLTQERRQSYDLEPSIPDRSR